MTGQRADEQDQRTEEAARELLTGVSLLGMRLRSLARDREVSAAGLGLLYRLHRYGPLGPTALAEYANRAPQTLTRVLAALEADHLIARHPDPTDARPAGAAAGRGGAGRLAGRRADRRLHRGRTGPAAHRRPADGPPRRARPAPEGG
jgi:hypothetical protein